MNQLKVELIADSTQLDRRVDVSKQKLETAERELQGFGKGARFGEDLSRQIEGIERRTLAMQRSFAGLRGPRGVFDPLNQDAARAQARAFQLQRQLEQIQRSIARGGSQTFLDELNADALRVEDSLKRLESQERRLQSFKLGSRGPGGGPRSGSGVGNDIGQGIAGGLGIPLGAGAAAAAGAALFVAGIDRAIDKAREAADANRLLTSSATEAGLAYSDAATKAANFAKQTGLQTTDAEATFASLIRVAQQSGQTQNLDKIQKALADLAAARGIKPSELTTLTQQILSGQDEALNRLGFADPSKLGDAYAKQIGKSSDQLTQQEQVYSRLKVLIEAGERVSGAAEDRLQSTTGQIDLAQQSLGNLTTQLGQAITGSIEFRDLLTTINGLLGSISISSDEVAKKLNEGLTPKQIAAEKTSGVPYALDVIKGGLTMQLAGAAFGFDVITGEGLDVAGNRLLAALTPWERRREELERQIEADKRKLDRQKSDADQAKKDSDQKAADAARQLAAGLTAKDSITKLTTTVSREDRLQPQIEGLKKLRAELEGYVQSGQLASDVTADFTTKLKSVDEQLYQTNKRVEEMIRTTFRDTRAFLEDMTQRVDRENPFVALFQQSDTVMQRTRERFLAFGEEFVQQMAAVESKAINLEIIAARLQQSQKVIGLEGEIRKLQFGPIAPSAEDQRRLDVYGTRVNAARDIPSLLAQAQAVQRGRIGPDGLIVDQGAVLRQQIAAILKLRTQFTGETGYGDRAARSLINQELVSLFQGASPEQQSRLLQGRGFREQLSGAFRGQAADRRQAIEDAIRRAEFSRIAVQTAEKQVADARRYGNFDDDTVRKEVLARTSALSPDELSPVLRRARTDALIAEAGREARKEELAAKDREKLNEVLDLIKSHITGKGFRLDQDGAGIVVDVRDSSDRAKVSLLGEGFK